MSIRPNNFNLFQSDIYSLGMVIYELLVRLEPFDDYDYSEERLIEEIVENNARPGFNDGSLVKNNFEGFLVPKFLENLIKKCWDKDPEKRLNCSEIDNYLEDNRVDQQETKEIDKFNQELIEINPNWKLK